jgi:sugar O-acyltransferase (sialic acid O-acetyltransferase NeuD family)
MKPDLSLILLGAGGHAKVLLALAADAGLQISGVCDPELARIGTTQWRGIAVLGGDEVLADADLGKIGLVNGIGQVVGGSVRARVYESLRARGFRFPPLVHRSAWVAPGTVLEDGAQVMAGAVVQPDCRIGANTIVNTRAGIDHDCDLGAHVHIAPGATLCGGVRVGAGAFVAAGATVIQGLNIGEQAVLGAGAVLVRDLEAGQVLLGSKARPGRPG